MPHVQDTPVYRRRRSEEIYAMTLASVEADGEVDEADRIMLDRLRVRLGLAAASATQARPTRRKATPR